MSCPHADPRRIEAFLRGELAAEERAELARHLEGECPECEELFASLDERALRAQLLAAHDRAVGFTPPTPEETRRAHARLLASFPARPRASLWPRLALVGLGACAVVAAALLLPGLLQRPGGGEDELRFKGGEVVLRIERGALRAGKLVVEGAVEPRARLSRDDRLLFSYGLPGRGRVELVRISAAGRETIYTSAAAEPGGLHRLADRGTPLMYSLEGLSGLQTFEARFTPAAGGPPSRARLELTVTP